MIRTRRKNNIIYRTVVDYINNNSKQYIIITIIFIIGIILGIIFVNNTDFSQQNKISEYINNFINLIHNNYNFSKIEILKKCILNNIYITLILWFLGSTVIGIPLIYLVIGYKGYTIGYTISCIIATLGIGKGLIFISASMLLQYILYIPCILSLGVSGINLYKLILEDRRKENIKIQIIKHTIFCILMLLILVIGSIIEAYISTSIIIGINKFL